MKFDSRQDDNGLPVAERIAYLIASFLGNTLTEAEHDELDEWVVASDDNTRLFEELTDEDNIEAGLVWHKNLQQKKALAKIKQEAGLRRKPLLLTVWPYVIAASLVGAIIGAYFFSTKSAHTTDQTTIVKKGSFTLPGTDRAVLTLDNGKTFILDSSGTGRLLADGGITVSKSGNGEVVYAGNSAQTLYHTLSTPRGGEYKITLSDGTGVWLNAESSLRFPASFDSSRREVQLRGEAYFEVARNKNSPFAVKILSSTLDSATVEVLGTRFNINSYSEEPTINTTLLEGSVRVHTRHKEVVIKPGEQARLSKDIQVIKADVDKEVAWKNGLFIFRDATMETIAHQIARWYDVTAEIKPGVSYHFNGTISRSEPLENLLHLLEATKRVHFTVTDKKLVIRP